MKSDKLRLNSNPEDTVEMHSTTPLENSQNQSSIQNVFIPDKQLTCCQRISQYWFPHVRLIERKITHNGLVYPANYMSNKIDNTKYNIMTFFPMVFFHQFKHFLNLYFLAIALLQFIPILQVGFLIRIGCYLRFSNSNNNDGVLCQRSR